MLSYGVSILYSFFQNKKKTKERMPLRMTEVTLNKERVTVVVVVVV
jgi:hypothetical protein